MSEAFNPEKVERWDIITRSPEPFTAPDEPYTSVVSAADYDKLLELYRAAVKGVEAMRCEECGERVRVTHVPRRAVTCPACKGMTLVRA